MNNQETIACISGLANLLWPMAQAGYKAQGRGGLMTSMESLQFAAGNGGQGALWLYATTGHFDEAWEPGQTVDALGILRRYQPANEMVIFITEPKGDAVRLHTYRIRVGLVMSNGNKEIH